MADKLTEDMPRTQKNSVREYALKVFKGTSITGFSNILSTGSSSRGVFRALMLLAFTAGFLTQSFQFLSFFVEYPTVLDIDMIRPDSYMVPAFTFCNCNRIKRSKYCQKFPENCVDSDEKVCKKFPRYCGLKKTKMPKMEFINEYSMPDDVNLELGHDIYDLIWSWGSTNAFGPTPIRVSGAVLGCYSINSLIDSPLDPVMRTPKDNWFPQHESFHFDAEEDETFNPEADPGIMFAIDSPFNPVNPFDKGIIMKPGFLYKITIRMYEEKSLPFPYRTNCMNYTEQWLENNKTGPRSQKACKDLCFLKYSHLCLNCAVPFSSYPTELNICTREEERLDTPCSKPEYIAHEFFKNC